MVELAGLMAVAFMSSAFTAVLGMGGGMMLIAVMSLVLPPTVVVPLHGAAQLASNLSRGLFGYRQIKWPLALRFGVGCLVGALLGSQLLIRFPTHYLPLPLGLFILLMTWWPWLKQRFWLPGGFMALGVVQAVLTLFVGASGPLNMPFLLREKLARDALVVTAASLMTMVHLTKLITFGALGFAYGDYGLLLAGLIAAVTLGSYVGSRWRHRLPEALFARLFRGVLTLLALRMIVGVLSATH